MASEITVAADSGPLTVVVSDFRDSAGNAAADPGSPNWAAGGSAFGSITPNPVDGKSATVILNGQVGEVGIEARFGGFTLLGKITTTPGPAITGSLNISA